MIYKDKFGNELELPAYTLDLEEKFSKADTGNTRETAQKKYELLKSIVDNDYLKDFLGGDTLETIDITELNVLFITIKESYELPAINAQLEFAQKTMETVLPMLDKIERMKANGGFKPNRQGFRNVK